MFRLRNRQRESRAFAELTVDGNFYVVVVGNPFCNRKTEPAALRRADQLFAFDTEESVENFFQVVRRNADARIRNGEQNIVPVDFRRDADIAAFGRVFYRVVQKNSQHLPNRRLVAENFYRVVLRKLNLVRRGDGAHFFHHVVYDVIQVQNFFVKGLSILIRACNEQQTFQKPESLRVNLNGTQIEFKPAPVYTSLRQIAWEVLESLKNLKEVK